MRGRVPVQVSPQSTPVPSVLFTGGVGDFIAVESFISDVERNLVGQVFLATRAHREIRSLIERGAVFPSAPRIVSLHDDWSDVFCTYSWDHFKTLVTQEGWDVNVATVPPLLDYSIVYAFDQIASGKRTYRFSNLLSRRLADVSGFGLPEDYAVIHPYSSNDRRGGSRDCTPGEWDAIIDHLRRSRRVGVVLLNSEDYVPDDPYLVNLANKTTIAESVEVVKGCREFIGVDSCFSVVAARMLPEERLTIRSTHAHYKQYLPIYCAPKTRFDFVVGDVRSRLKRGAGA